MQAARRVYYATNLIGLQGKGSLLKLLLHIPPSEIPEVAALPCAAAVGFGNCKIPKRDAPALDGLLVPLNDLPGIVLASSDIGLRRRRTFVSSGPI